MNDQCKFCIHADVCKYKGHYTKAVEICEKVKEGVKYPFLGKIECVRFISSAQSMDDQCKDDQCNDERCKFCVIENMCPYKEQYKEAIKKYKKVQEKCEKYPFEIKCAFFTKPKK